MVDKMQESLEAIAASLKQCFIGDYHQGITISPKSGKNLIATWWFERVDYKPRRWTVSIRFPGDLIARYSDLNDAEKNRVRGNVRDTVVIFVGDLEGLEEGQIKHPAEYVCELDERMFD